LHIGDGLIGKSAPEPYSLFMPKSDEILNLDEVEKVIWNAKPMSQNR
jgi:hypothetical protein